MKKKLALICGVILIISSFTACGPTQGTLSEKKTTEKLPLTKENLKNVFKDYNYTVSVQDINNSNKSISATFSTDEAVARGQEKEELEKIESILHEKFDINNDNTVNDFICENNDRTIVSRYFSKIEVGENPEIYVKDSGIVPHIEYRLNSEFNLLSPYKNLKVSAKDEEDGDLTNKIKIQNPEVLQKECTNKKLIYEVIDSDGNTATKEFNIDVFKGN